MPEDKFRVKQFDPELDSPATNHARVVLDQVIDPRPRALYFNSNGVVLIEDAGGVVENYDVEQGDILAFRVHRVVSNANVDGSAMTTTATDIKAWR